MRQWISWFQPSVDYRPITYPTGPEIVGWWKSGEEPFGRHILCALVTAETDRDAMSAVAAHWPEASEFRFCVPKPGTWSPPPDRFPFKAGGAA